MPDRVEPLTARRVLERLGHDAPPRADWDGLSRLYRSWCRHVPSDNVLDLLAVRAHERAPLPGGSAEAFFAAWLADGAGGASWPTANALNALLKACGFEVRRVAGFIGDVSEANHGSLVVDLDGGEYLLDTTILCEAPLRLPGEGKLSLDDPLHPVRVDPIAEGWRVEAADPFDGETVRIRIDGGEVDLELFLERHELGWRNEPVAAELLARRNAEGRVVSFRGARRAEKTADRTTHAQLAAGELDAALASDLGFSKSLVERLRGSGALDA